MSASNPLRESIETGRTRADHDHVADHRNEVLPTVALCAECGHLESAHHNPGCDASQARFMLCSCDYYLPRRSADASATVQFSDGTVVLTDWRITDLDPDNYGRCFRQIVGWRVENSAPVRIVQGTNRLVRTLLPGRSEQPRDLNVQVSRKVVGLNDVRWCIEWLRTPPAGSTDGGRQ